MTAHYGRMTKRRAPRKIRPLEQTFKPNICYYEQQFQLLLLKDPICGVHTMDTTQSYSRFDTACQPIDIFCAHLSHFTFQQILILDTDNPNKNKMHVLNHEFIY